MLRQKIVVVGACGKMGRQIVESVVKNDDLNLVGAVDVVNIGEDIGSVVLNYPLGIPISGSIEEVSRSVDGRCTVIEFTHRDAAVKHILSALQVGYYAVVGTTGLTDEDLQNMDRVARENNTGILVAPNYSLGAVLMMKYAAEIVKYLPEAQIIEYHNTKKVDSPSGTSLATAKKMEIKTEGRADENTDTGSLGLDVQGVRIHSVRLSSFIAHQEVIFSGLGELLTIRHDSLSRESFMPGLFIGVKKVTSWQGLKVGLEKVLD